MTLSWLGCALLCLLHLCSCSAGGSHRSDGGLDTAAALPYACGPVQGLAQRAAWPMKGAGPSRCRRSRFVGVDMIGVIEENWSFAPSAGTEIDEAIIGEDGRIFASANGPRGRMWALAERDGTEQWTTDTLVEPQAPALSASGATHLATGLELYSFDLTGTERWRSPRKVLAASSPAIGKNGQIYVSGAAGLLSLSSNGGSYRWNVQLATTMPAVGPDGTIYVGSEGALLAFDPTGTQTFSYALPNKRWPTSPAVAPDGTIYLAGSRPNSSGPLGTIAVGSRLYAVSPSGELRWAFDSETAISCVAVGADGGVIAPSAAEQLGGAARGPLYSLRPNGLERWHTGATGVSPRCGGVWTSCPMIDADGRVYVADARCLTAYSRDGKKLFDFFLPGDDVIHKAHLSLGRDGTVYVAASYTKSPARLIAVGRQ